MDLDKLRLDARALIENVLELTAVKPGQLFVLGLSSSEVAGGVIGKASSAEIGEVIVGELFDAARERGILLAVQACEHLNRALLVERTTAEKFGYEEVSVIPQLHAGGSGQVAAYKLFSDPVEVEAIQAFAGLDIGDTGITHNIKAVQIPVRPENKALGGAHVTAFRSRPKLIGGERAVYQ